MPKVSKNRVIDFTRYAQRHVALWVCYQGWDYGGLAVQKDTNAQNTIEFHLHNALDRTKLVKDVSNCGLKKTGRTDKGVSAFQQVFSLHVRSSLSSGVGVSIPEGHDISRRPEHAHNSEYSFTSMLNGCLPKDIRVIAWSPIPNDCDFNARHSTTKRTYKYVFPKAGMDIELMRTAAKLLVGEHDFRNFCKLSGRDERTMADDFSFVRNIFDVTVEPIASSHCMKDTYSMCELTVSGSGFLWNQIRCIVSVLFMVGEGKEQPTIISSLLSISQFPSRPTYGPASPIPLCLFQVEYENTPELVWQWDTNGLHEVLITLQRKWAELQAKASIVQNMIGRLESMLGSSGNGHLRALYGPEYTKTHKPISQRELMQSVSEKRQNYASRKRKLEEEKHEEIA